MAQARTYTIQPGGRWQGIRNYGPRKYPWAGLRPGDVVEDAFPMERLNAVRQSVRTFNMKHRAAVTIRQLKEGTKDHPFPHFRVGWIKGDRFGTSSKVRTAPPPQPRRPKKANGKNSEPKSGEKE